MINHDKSQVLRTRNAAEQFTPAVPATSNTVDSVLSGDSFLYHRPHAPLARSAHSLRMGSSWLRRTKLPPISQNRGKHKYTSSVSSGVHLHKHVRMYFSWYHLDNIKTSGGCDYLFSITDISLKPQLVSRLLSSNAIDPKQLFLWWEACSEERDTCNLSLTKPHLEMEIPTS